MNENNKKSKAGLIVIIIAIALMIIEAALQIAFSKNTGIGILVIFVPYVMLLICGIVLMFAKIKKFGWAIVASLALGGIVSNLFNKDFQGALIGAVIAIVCILLLVHENTKKQN